MGEVGGLGDKITLAPFFKGADLKPYAANKNQKISDHALSEDSGMPFYFKDLRDNTFIMLRGYLSGITETYSPTWNAKKYLGRSEPVYTYESATRSISFTMTLTAQSALELDSIYGKLRRLSSFCYPEYANDENLGMKMRMKPPLIRMRLGELFGNRAENKSNSKDLLGFFDALTNTVPETSTWEFRKGQRVPKLITSAVTFKVIHDSPPDMATPFYGYIGGTGTADIADINKVGAK